MALLFGSQDSARSHQLARAVAAGRYRKLASRIYTDDLVTAPTELIRRHWREIVAHFHPGAVVSHRSAIELAPSPAGKLHLTVAHAVGPVWVLPGLEVRLWRGPAPFWDDVPLDVPGGGSLFRSGEIRAVLENLQVSRARVGDEPKILERPELLKRLSALTMDDVWVERMRALADEAGWRRERHVAEMLGVAMILAAHEERSAG